MQKLTHKQKYIIASAIAILIGLAFFNFMEWLFS